MNVHEISHQVLLPTGLPYQFPQKSTGIPPSVGRTSRPWDYDMLATESQPSSLLPSCASAHLTDDGGVGVIPGNDLYFLGMNDENGNLIVNLGFG